MYTMEPTSATRTPGNGASGASGTSASGASTMRSLRERAGTELTTALNDWCYEASKFPREVADALLTDAYRRVEAIENGEPVDGACAAAARAAAAEHAAKFEQLAKGIAPDNDGTIYWLYSRIDDIKKRLKLPVSRP